MCHAYVTSPMVTLLEPRAGCGGTAWLPPPVVSGHVICDVTGIIEKETVHSCQGGRLHPLEHLTSTVPVEIVLFSLQQEASEVCDFRCQRPLVHWHVIFFLCGLLWPR